MHVINLEDKETPDEMRNIEQTFMWSICMHFKLS